MKKEKIDYLTFISVVSAFSVLVLHTNGCFWDFSEEPYWKNANIIESVFYFAVPLFYMISGIKLMDFYDRNTLKEYFVKRFNRAVVPFLAWNLIGVLIGILLKYIRTEDINLKYLYKGITESKIVDMFWFFTPLFIIYLCMPLFAAVDKCKRKEVFTYLVFFGSVINIGFPFLKEVFYLDYNFPYVITVVSGALIWPVLGWLLHNWEMKKWHKRTLYIFAVIGFLMHMCGTYILSVKAGEVVCTYKGYENVPCLLYSVGAFVFLKDIGTRIMRSRFANFITVIGKYTFPIYLMQFFFLSFSSRLSFVNKYSLLYRLGAPFIIIPMIMTITWCLRKIPVVRRIVP